MSTMEEVFQTLQSTQARLIGALPAIARPGVLPGTESRAILLHGPRGTGKTQYLLRTIRERGGVYIPADYPAVSERPLLDWLEALHSRGVEAVYIDEVDYARDWAISLKAAYDSFPGMRLWASGSNSLLADSGIADLSRRFLDLRMPYLSFREFLVLNGQPDFGIHDPFSSTEWAESVLKSLNVLAWFEKYLEYGFRPIFLEGLEGYGGRILQSFQKTIESDIPFLVPSLNANQLRLMHAIAGFLARSPIPTLSLNSLCREWNVSKEKLYSLLQAMERAGAINIVRKASDHAASSIGAKIFFGDPSYYRVLGGKEGNAREASVVTCLRDAGYEVEASRDETVADFIVDGRTSLEVGGSHKKRKGADIVIRDGTDWPSRGVIPLWMLGFMH